MSIAESVDRIYRTESRPALATLIRLLGDFELAEDSLHEAFAIAMQKWGSEGVPDNPRAWLISTARFKAIDTIRRRVKFDASLAILADQIERAADAEREVADEVIKDDQLRLIFTCCHPALPAEARVALTLREVCGLTTEEIAKAFLTAPPTVAQRIVRAKNKIRDTKIPYDLPDASVVSERLDTVLQVVYLVFNEGYYATSGDAITRSDLSQEAIRLGRLVLGLLPEPEVIGLVALMLLQESRRAARSTCEGDVVLLEEQDRSLWNRDQINEGISLVEQALTSRRFGPYTLQAAIAAVHSEAKNASETDWPQIVSLYDVLYRILPSPIVELNRAVAVAMRDGEDKGLAIIDSILARGALEDYSLAHAARADLYRRLARTSDARNAFQKALQLAKLEPERRFLQRRIDELEELT